MNSINLAGPGKTPDAELTYDKVTGRLWARELRNFADDPGKRLRISMFNLPLPGAFINAAEAIRTIIKRREASGEDVDDCLILLYLIAAIESFAMPYAEDRELNLRVPGFNVVVLVPSDKLQSLPFEWRTLGYRNLRLLKSADKKALIARWGEPEGHTTLNALHRALWDEYAQKALDNVAMSDEAANAAMRRYVGSLAQ